MLGVFVLHTLDRPEGFLIADLSLPFNVSFSADNRARFLKRISEAVETEVLLKERILGFASLSRASFDVWRVNNHFTLSVIVSSRCR